MIVKAKHTLIYPVWLIFASLTDLCKRDKQTQDKSCNKRVRRQHFALIRLFQVARPSLPQTEEQQLYINTDLI